MKKYKHIGFNIGDQAAELLLEFSDVQYLSSYMACSNLKQDDPTMDYKNTHKRVKRLESLEFIEPVKAKEVKVEDARHGAKYYRISEAGMMHLFLREAIWLIDKLPTIIQTHGNYLIFETVLYPYFKKETLSALGTAVEALAVRTPKGIAIPIILSALGGSLAPIIEGAAFEILAAMCYYIRNCCVEIYAYIKALNHPMPKLNTQEKRALLDKEHKLLVDHIALEKDYLVMKILLCFRSYRKTKRPDVLAILAQDDKFMNIAQDLHKDFNRSFE